MAYHSYPTISGIASKEECERLHKSLMDARWSAKREDYHVCVPYQTVVK